MLFAFPRRVVSRNRPRPLREVLAGIGGTEPLRPTRTRDRAGPRPIETLLDEQSVCWRRGGPIRVEEFLDRSPGLRDDPEGVLDLIVHELSLRERAGESPARRNTWSDSPGWPAGLSFSSSSAICSARADGTESDDGKSAAEATSPAAQGPPRHRPVTRSKSRSAGAAWGSSTGPGNSP